MRGGRCEGKPPGTLRKSLGSFNAHFAECPRCWGFSSEGRRQSHDFSELVHVCLASQSCLTLCDPMDCSLPGSSVHGIPQARILEWLPCPPPGHLPNPGTEPRFPALQADSLVSEPPEKKGGGGDSGPSRVLMGTLKQGVGRSGESFRFKQGG